MLLELLSLMVFDGWSEELKDGLFLDLLVVLDSHLGKVFGKVSELIAIFCRFLFGLLLPEIEDIMHQLTLLRKQLKDQIIHRVLRMHVVDVHRVHLTDPMSTVFSLHHYRRSPRKLSEYDSGGRS